MIMPAEFSINIIFYLAIIIYGKYLLCCRVLGVGQRGVLHCGGRSSSPPNAAAAAMGEGTGEAEDGLGAAAAKSENF